MSPDGEVISRQWTVIKEHLGWARVSQGRWEGGGKLSVVSIVFMFPASGRF